MSEEIKDPFENYTEKEIFEYQIWELELKIDAAEAHFEVFKESGKLFKNKEKRVKGVDTVFYELNHQDWVRMHKTSLNKFEKEYGEKYDQNKVRHTKKGRINRKYWE